MKNGIVKRFFLFIWDVFAVFLSSFVSLLLIQNDDRFDEYLHFLNYYVFIEIFFVIILMLVFKLYKSILKYASISEMIRLIFVSAIIFIINMLTSIITGKIAISWCITNFMMLFLLTSFSRYSYRLIKRLMLERKEDKIKRVMIIGAGDAGGILIKEMLDSEEIKMKPVCIIDDNQDKYRMTISNIQVVGNRNDIIEASIKYKIDVIIIAIPSARSEEIASILSLCQETKCKLQILPGIYQLINGEVSVKNVRDVEIEDLLGREPIKIYNDKVEKDINGKVILITGGGGSIGSELCRQIAQYNPKQLIIVDIYENNAYDIQMELSRKYPSLNLVVLIASVRDKNKIDSIFKKYHPDIVCHAAAHKHVPLMEISPIEAVKNNVFGTLNVAQCADKYHVKRFIQISTDKAVNPTNIMGATKRICEMIIQTINKHSNTDFVAVRFGNVLGSNGSVIPLFKKQIEEGGPVTVTDPNITRFFMTIPEAVSLVLQAQSFATGGEIFVLDMGSPVKIYDLAVTLIKLLGHIPNGDIKIEFTGLRPGEKLYEELLMNEEGLKTTDNKRIKIGMPIELDENSFFTSLNELYKAINDESCNIKELVHNLVPTYKIDHSCDDK